MKSSNRSATPKKWSCHYHDHWVNYRRSSISDTSELNQNTWIALEVGGARTSEEGMGNNHCPNGDWKCSTREEEGKRKRERKRERLWADEMRNQARPRPRRRQSSLRYCGRRQSDSAQLRVTLKNGTAAAICMPLCTISNTVEITYT